MNLSELEHIQRRVAARVVITRLQNVNIVVGVDAAYAKDTPLAVGAAVVMSLSDMELLEQKTIFQKVAFPYIPRYFAFREFPLLKHVLSTLDHDFDLIFCDGHGLAHPRRCGIATHLGVILQKATIGVAKNRLVGTGSVPELRRGRYTLLKAGKEVIGAVLCTQDHVKPVFVSIGNLITLPQAIGFTLEASPKYRLPEPIRQAHLLANKVLKETMEH